MEAELKFDLTVDETNAILRALGQQPYAQVAPLITKMKVQAQPQLEALSQDAQGEMVDVEE